MNSRHPDRTLHLVDVANLAGVFRHAPNACEQVLTLYRTVVSVSPGDHVVVGLSRHLAARAVGRIPTNTALRCPQASRSGADALLRHIVDIGQVARSYGRVVVGSGNALFAVHTTMLRRRGAYVVVVAPPGALAGALADAADEVTTLTFHSPASAGSAPSVVVRDEGTGVASGAGMVETSTAVSTARAPGVQDLHGRQSRRNAPTLPGRDLHPETYVGPYRWRHEPEIARR